MTTIAVFNTPTPATFSTAADFQSEFRHNGHPSRQLPSVVTMPSATLRRIHRLETPPLAGGVQARGRTSMPEAQWLAGMSVQGRNMVRKVKKAIQGYRHGSVPRPFREAQLLDVAQRLFAEKGYQGASIEGIAEAAGVTRPMVYFYFESKDGIYLACLRRARAELDAEMANADQGATAEERLYNVTDAYFRFVEERPGTWEVLYGGGIAVAGPAAEEASQLRFRTVARIADFLKTIFRPGFSEQQIHAFAHLMSGAGEQLAKWWRQNPDIPRQQIVRYQVATFWTGVSNLEPANLR